MFKSKMVRIFTVLIYLSTVTSFKILKHTNKPLSARRDSAYDQYVFATEWVGTACKFNDCQNQINSKHFNIHGLWPSSDDESPEDCDDLDFKEADLNSYLQQNLFDYWNGCYQENWDFVSYELKKHGTCWKARSGNTQQMDPKIVEILQAFDPDDKHSKFNTFMTLALYMSKKINPLQMLADAGIMPGQGKRYAINQFIDLFNDKFGLQTAVIPICLKDKDTDDDYISEIRLCFDLNYEHINCDPEKVKKGIEECGEDAVYYPEFKNSVN